MHVVVGVIQNSRDEILISYRKPALHQGGLWEFPGGKVDRGETPAIALCREFEEELGIQPTQFFPFTQIKYKYPDKSVLLDVWRITQFVGEPFGKEGQSIEWRHKSKFDSNDFPAANAPIIRLSTLPQLLPITPIFESLDLLLTQLGRWIDAQYSLVFIRQPQLDPKTYSHWFSEASKLCLNSHTRLIHSLEHDCEVAYPSLAGFHASSAKLLEMQGRPFGDEYYLSVSCRNELELDKALQVSADFAFLSPVHRAELSPHAIPLEWDGFASIAGHCKVPLYAIGDVSLDEREQALSAGAYGIAGVTAFV